MKACGRASTTPLPPDEVADIGARVATALADLHRQHVVHLDIKPNNIVFRPDGTAVLVDFGLSRHEQLPDLLEESSACPWAPGPICRPSRCSSSAMTRAAICSRSASCCITSPPASGPGPAQLGAWPAPAPVVDPVPPRAIDPSIPPWLQEIILHCLEVKPEQRYQSAAQLALDLREPDGVVLTARAERVKVSSLSRRLRRWFFAGAEAQSSYQPGEQLAQSPIIMAAVDIEHATQGLLNQLRDTVRRIVQTEAGARLACVSVMKTNRIGVDELTDKAGKQPARQATDRPQTLGATHQQGLIWKMAG